MPPPQGTPNPFEGPGDYTMTKQVHSDTYPAIDPTRLPTPLTDRAVFISGASRGIGKAMALSFAKAGASKIAIGARADLSSLADELRTTARAAGRGEPQVLCVKIEISDAASVEAAAASIDKAFGRCDIVVQNAGVFGRPAKIADADPEEWWKVYEVNVKGQFLVAKYFLPLMTRPHGPGALPGLKTFVMTSSIGAHLSMPTLSQYQPTKLLLLRLAEFIDSEYGEQGVSAFCIHPGNVVTDMTGGPDGEISKVFGHIFVDTPEIAGDTVVFLTAEKRQWLSGRYINCTWDMPELLAQEEEIIQKDKLKVRMMI